MELDEYLTMEGKTTKKKKDKKEKKEKKEKKKKDKVVYPTVFDSKLIERIEKYRKLRRKNRKEGIKKLTSSENTELLFILSSSISSSLTYHALTSTRILTQHNSNTRII
jgi:hypothetical protein